MTLPQPVVYVVTPNKLSDSLRSLCDSSRHLFLLEETAFLSREPPVEHACAFLNQAKVAILGYYWESFTPELLEGLFATERDPVAMFDARWSIRRFNHVHSLQHAIENVSTSFANCVVPCDEEVGEFVNWLKDQPPRSWIEEIGMKDDK